CVTRQTCLVAKSFGARRMHTCHGGTATAISPSTNNNLWLPADDAQLRLAPPSLAALPPGTTFADWPNAGATAPAAGSAAAVLPPAAAMDSVSRQDERGSAVGERRAETPADAYAATEAV